MSSKTVAKRSKRRARQRAPEGRPAYHFHSKYQGFTPEQIEERVRGRVEPRIPSNGSSPSPWKHYWQCSNSRQRSMIQYGMIEPTSIGLSHSFWQMARNISSMEMTVVLATVLSYPMLSGSALQWASIDLEPHSTCQSYVSF